MQNFQALGALPPDPQNSTRNYEFLAMCFPRFALCIFVWGFVAFVLNNFFFIIQLQTNLIMLTTDVCLMLNCFLFEKFYLHYALSGFDSILLHYAKLFIRQSIDREQIFDVTFENPPLKNLAYATAQTNSLLYLFRCFDEGICVLPKTFSVILVNNINKAIITMISCVSVLAIIFL